MRGKWFWPVILGLSLVMLSACTQPRRRVLVPVPLPKPAVDTQAEPPLFIAHSLVLPPSWSFVAARPLPVPIKPLSKRARLAKSAPKEPMGGEELNSASNGPANPSPLQLAPDIPENEKRDLMYKTEQELKSAQGLLDNLIRRHHQNFLSSEQKTTVSTIQDFMEKSRDARKRGITIKPTRWHKRPIFWLPAWKRIEERDWVWI